MLSLIFNYFTFKRLVAQMKNRNLSFLTFYDKSTEISNKSKIQRFVIARESKIDYYSYIGYSSNLNTAVIGKFCSISKHVNIGITHHPSDFISTSPIFFSKKNATGFKWINENVYDEKPKPVTIGNDVWIGMNVTVMGGVTIGNGVIIGAHSVVTKDIPPYAIVVGVPARIIKYRFDEEVVAKLQLLSWWNLPELFLKNNIKKFQKKISASDLIELIENVDN